MAKGKKRITAQDLYRFELITDMDFSPDGKHVVYAQQRVDRKTEKKFSNLYLAPAGAGRPKQFTYGNHVDAKPRFSPDGKSIAFISNRHDEKQPQIHIIPLDGGEARKLTDFKGSIVSIGWTPDGKQLVITFWKKDKEAIEREKDEQKKKLGVVARHYDRAFFKLDGLGYLPKERIHIWTVNARTGKAKQLTDSKTYDEYAPDISPDGRRIAFASNRSEDPDLDPDQIDIFVMSSKGGRIRKVETPPGPKGAPAFSPDGKWLAYYGTEGKSVWWKNTRLWIVAADGRSQARCLTGHADFNVAGGTINDIVGVMELPKPLWSPDGGQIYFPVSHHGDTVVKKVSVHGTSPEPEDVVAEKGVVGKYVFDKSHEKLCYYFGTMTDPGELYVRNLVKSTTKKLTKVNAKVLGRHDLGEVEEVWWRGPAGNKLQGWILKPPGFSPRKKYPAILEIHGGPRVQYGNLFMHEFYCLAAAGYVVFFTNPRGSQGYGEKHSKAISNNWGGPDYADLMAWTSYVSRKPYVDGKRMGVTGGSYGGYMTNWIIGHTKRFKAAVTQRSVSNLLSMYGSSDFNWVFQAEFGDRPPWEGLQNYWRQSPMKYMGNARTPTLVIHSEMDLRCAIEQGEQVYVALKKLGVDTELVRFPGEPHGLSRGGRTDRRIARLKHILRWFDKYLKKRGK